MKKLYTILLCLSCFSLYAQFGINAQWTWIKGDNTFNQLSDYGVKGVTASANKPSARAGAAVWTDATGNTYIYSGNFYADMWKYEPANNNWTWVAGDNVPNTSAIYGTQGVANTNNSPGLKQYSSTWKDNNGKFWLYSGTNSPDDLWKFDPNTNNWTWIKGNSSGTISPNYVGSTKTPGSRVGATTWTDASGNLWLFGGFSGSYKNDLWKYDVALDQWIYYSTVSAPSVRSNALGWTSNSGELYLFGGSFTFENVLGYNDLWKYNTSAGTWTQVRANQAYNYGTKGIATAANNPSGRFAATGWKDNSGNFWMFGGMYPNPACSTACAYGTLEDMWKYNVASNQWTWMKGSTDFNTLGDYGSLGISSATNKPGARKDAMSFFDNNGNFYLFGGSDTLANYLNDLWKISGTALPLKLLLFDARRENGNVLLNWQTTNDDVNTVNFNIQKSNNSSTFTTIGKVNTIQGGSIVNNYSFKDPFEKEEANLFYRLEIMDQDGSKTYSAVVHIKDQSGLHVQLTPNPATTELKLHISSGKAQTFTVLVRHVNGSLSKREIFQAANGSTTKIVNISTLPKGAYIITLTGSADVINQYFIKF